MLGTLWEMLDGMMSPDVTLICLTVLSMSHFLGFVEILSPTLASTHHHLSLSPLMSTLPLFFTSPSLPLASFYSSQSAQCFIWLCSVNGLLCLLLTMLLGLLCITLPPCTSNFMDIMSLCYVHCLVFFILNKIFLLKKLNKMWILLSA